jgi:uncharacterized ion transporter superfamily protein YfcC
MSVSHHRELHIPAARDAAPDVVANFLVPTSAIVSAALAIASLHLLVLLYRHLSKSNAPMYPQISFALP